MPGAVQDVMTPANFYEDRFRGFGVARGRILAFSIDLLRRLQNTLALPCECGMFVIFYLQKTFEQIVVKFVSSFVNTIETILNSSSTDALDSRIVLCLINTCSTKVLQKQQMPNTASQY